MRRRNTYLHYFLERQEQDRGMTVLITAYFTLMLLMMLVAGIAIWPVMFYGASSGASLAPLCQSLVNANLLLLTAYVILAAVLLWFDRSFSLVKTALINLFIGGVVNLALLLSQGSGLTSGPEAGFMMTLLWFILSILLSLVLALLPAVLVAAVSKLIHSAFFLLHR